MKSPADPSMTQPAPNAGAGGLWAPPNAGKNGTQATHTTPPQQPGRNGTRPAVTPSATVRPLERVLALLKDVTGPKGGQWTARCPAHEDHTPSLSIREGDDGRVLLHCHAVCATEAIVAKIELTMRDLFVQNGNGLGGGLAERIEEVYQYRDERGEVLSEVVRLKARLEDRKEFLQRRPDGNGGHVWSVQGVRRVLYRLPDLIETDPECVVFVVEGEKDADRLWDLNIPATTCPEGAAKWASVDDQVLAGRPVIVIPDNDDPGIAHAQDVAQRLAGKAASVRILRLPGLAEGGDVSDWLDAGGTAEGLHQLAEAAPAVAPAEAPHQGPERLHRENTENMESREGEGTLGKGSPPCEETPPAAAPPASPRAENTRHPSPKMEGEPSPAASPPIWDGDVGALDDLVGACLPATAKGYRKALFRLARRLRFDDRLRGLPVAPLRPIVDHWCDRAADAITGRTRSQVWFGFCYGWDRVKYPVGAKPAAEAFQTMSDAPDPPCVADYADDPDVQTLVRLLAQMQRMAGPGGDWPMSIDTMAYYVFGVPMDWRRRTEAPQAQQREWARKVKKANLYILGLMRDGVVERSLEVAFEMKPAKGKSACRYRFIKPLGVPVVAPGEQF